MERKHHTLYLYDRNLWDRLKAKALIAGLGHHEYIEDILLRADRGTHAHGLKLNNNELRDKLVRSTEIHHMITLNVALEVLDEYGCTLRKCKELMKELVMLGIFKSKGNNIWVRMR